MFDTAKITPGTKLIGRCHHYDRQKKYKYLSFIIEDTTAIRQALKLLVTGKEVKNRGEDPDFAIELIQQYKRVGVWSVNPSFKNAMNGGKAYYFDSEKIKELAEKYPFEYRFDAIVFKSEKEYDTYVAKQKQEKSFLFSYEPFFRYEGSFEIKFPRNQKFQSPQDVSDYLSPIIEKIVSEDEYSLGYELDERNMKDPGSFIMTIEGSRKLFDKLKVDGYKKENWKASVETGFFFYKTN
ncbi:hypothetical protein JMG10_11160 [Nostoc ellipsosporum NOK]|nr:hypothetical protein [Nostoc ellipsosporum NOK]